MLLRLVQPRLIKKLQLHTKVRVERPGGAQETILKRNLHPIHISAEDRGSRKFITKISGLEDFCIDPAEFSSTCQKAFSSSAAVGAVNIACKRLQFTHSLHAPRLVSNP
jgi:translation initiation factor 1 (eIF-1/SUI1)